MGVLLARQRGRLPGAKASTLPSRPSEGEPLRRVPIGSIVGISIGDRAMPRLQFQTSLPTPNESLEFSLYALAL